MVGLEALLQKECFPTIDEYITNYITFNTPSSLRNIDNWL